MARRITGRPHTRYTSGPATSRALAAAGALGATTGSVVHLPAPPSSTGAGARVLLHELTHSRTPLLRPRFLLGGLPGHDEEERTARAGEGLLGHSDASSLLAQVSSAVTSPIGLPDRGFGAPRSGQPSVTSAVRQLPVGGLAGLSDVLRSRPPTPGAADATGTPAALGDPATGIATGAPNVQPGYRAAAAAQPEDSADAPQATTAQAPAPTAPQTGHSTAVQLDGLLDALEDRLLRELERRGGRYQGVF